MLLRQPLPSYSDDNDIRSYLSIFLLGPVTMEIIKGQKNVVLDIFPPCKDVESELGYGRPQESRQNNRMPIIWRITL